MYDDPLTAGFVTVLKAKAALISFVGVLVGLLGAVFSFLAWRSAQSASEIARATRGAFQQRAFVDELQDACSHAEQLVDYLKTSRDDAASLRAVELQGLLAAARERRAAHVTGRMGDRLQTVLQQVKVLENELAGEWGKELSASQRGRLLKIATSQILLELRAVLGEAQANEEDQ